MKETTQKCIDWVKSFLDLNRIDKVVIGISGGKDSSVCAAICSEAIGNKNVYGVILPNGSQKDISDSKKIIDFLKINSSTINISTAYKSILKNIESPSDRAKINLAPRLRSVVLYAVAQSLGSAFVCNTSNLDERLVGYSTIWGDSIGDFSPIGNLHVSEVKEIGNDLKLPKELVCKAPNDGLSGMTDEEKLGFSYLEVEKLSKKIVNFPFSYHPHSLYEQWLPVGSSMVEDPRSGAIKFSINKTERKIAEAHDRNLFKMRMIQIPSYLPEFKFKR